MIIAVAVISAVGVIYALYQYRKAEYYLSKKD